MAGANMATTVERLGGGLQANTERITQLEQKCAELQQSVTSLQQDHDDLAEKHSRAVAELGAQLDDQENCQRRKNLRNAGFPDGTEGNDVVALLEKWVPSILGLFNTPAELWLKEKRSPIYGSQSLCFVIFIPVQKLVSRCNGLCLQLQQRAEQFLYVL